MKLTQQNLSRTSKPEFEAASTALSTQDALVNPLLPQVLCSSQLSH